MPANFRAVMPVLIVANVEPTRAFFVERFGFAQESEAADAGRIGSCVVKRGNVRLNLRSEEDVRDDVYEKYVPGPWKAAIYIDVDDVDLLVPEVADADIVLAPRRTAAGMHEIGVREPGGNIIIFTSPVK